MTTQSTGFGSHDCEDRLLTVPQRKQPVQHPEHIARPLRQMSQRPGIILPKKFFSDTVPGHQFIVSQGANDFTVFSAGGKTVVIEMLKNPQVLFPLMKRLHKVLPEIPGGVTLQQLHKQLLLARAEMPAFFPQVCSRAAHHVPGVCAD